MSKHLTLYCQHFHAFIAIKVDYQYPIHSNYILAFCHTFLVKELMIVLYQQLLYQQS